MKTTISTLAIFFAMAIAFVSCNTTEENTAPQINILKPSASDNPHMSGMPITVHVEVTDDDELHETSISIVRQHDSAEVYHNHGHTHESVYTVMEDTVFTTSMHSDFTVTVMASDHDGEESIVHSTFNMNPM